MKFCLYRIETGEILQKFETEHVEEQRQEGCEIYFGDVDDVRTRIIDGKPVEYIPAAPSTDHVFDRVLWKWRPVDQDAIDDDIAARRELRKIDASLIRYLVDKDAGILDAVGQEKFDSLKAQKVELRKKLIPAKKDAK